MTPLRAAGIRILHEVGSGRLWRVEQAFMRMVGCPT